MKVFLDIKVEFRDPERDKLCRHPESIQTQEQGRVAEKAFLGLAYLLHKKYRLGLLALEQNAEGIVSTMRSIREGKKTWEEALGLKERSGE